MTAEARYLQFETMRRPDQARQRVPTPNPHRKGLCRWCGGAVPKGRRSWCGDGCVNEVLALYPSELRRGAELRDEGKCALCGAQGGAWEADHTVPLCEGGLNLLSNIRTLCRACHLSETRALTARRVARRKAAR